MGMSDEAWVREEVKHYPRLTRFYGLTVDQLGSMPRNLLTLYIEAMPELAAEEQMRLIKGTHVRYMEDGPRRSYLRQLEHDAGIRGTNAPAEQHLDPVKDKDVLASLGIGVIIEKKAAA